MEEERQEAGPSRAQWVCASLSGEPRDGIGSPEAVPSGSAAPLPATCAGHAHSADTRTLSRGAQEGHVVIGTGALAGGPLF